MVDFIGEVQEELRKDDYNRWLRKYGPYLAGLIVLIVGYTGYLEWQKYNDRKISENTSYEFIQAVEAIDEDKEQAVANFVNLASSAPEGYAGISLMRAAELELEAGNKLKAVEFFDQAAATFSRSRHAHLAQLKAGYILAGEGSYDEVISRMQALISDEAPFKFLAKELLAFSAKQTGDLKTARMYFSDISTDLDAPETIVNRAEQNLILMDQITTEPTETVPAEPVTPLEEPTKEDTVPTEAPTNE